MSVKNYSYHGPTSSVTLSDGDEHSLFDGKTYPLPENNPFVASLVRQRRLKEVKVKQAETKPAKAPKPQKPKDEQEKKS